MNEINPFSPFENDDIIDFLKHNISIKEIYDRLLQQQIIEKTCEEKKITVTDEEIEIEANKWRYANKLEKAKDVFAWLKEQKITPDDWENGIRARILREKLADFLFIKEINKYFVEHKIDFQQVLLYQIVVTNEKLAQELFFQIEEQEISFYQASHLYDLDENRRLRCGYEGKIYRRQLNPDLASIVFSANKGEITTPFKTELGYHIFLIENFFKAELTPTIKQEIKHNLFNQWLLQEMNYAIYN
jgi:parvulin-like peptidyl-prolyl isomerase